MAATEPGRFLMTAGARISSPEAGLLGFTKNRWSSGYVAVMIRINYGGYLVEVQEEN